MKKLSNANLGKAGGLWYAVSLFGFFVFPVGFILLIVSTVHELRTQREKNEKILSAGVLLLFAALSMLCFLSVAAVTGDFGSMKYSYELIVYGPAALLGLLEILVYAVTAVRIGRLNTCRMLICRERITSVETLCEISGFSRRRLRRLIRALVRRGELVGASLGKTDADVVFTKSVWAKQRVQCLNCGAALTVDFGRTLTCEYCGGALEVKRIEW